MRNLILFLLIIGCSSSSGESVDIDRVLTMTVRSIAIAADQVEYDTEADTTYRYEMISFKPEEAALILMDVWDSSVNDGFAKRLEQNIVEKLFPAVTYARSVGINIIHSPHLTNGKHKIHPLCTPIPGEKVVDGATEQQDLEDFLISKNIQYVFYVGYASNMCLLMRPTGIPELVHMGFRTVFIRDASLAVESPFFPMGTTHEVMTSVYETYGSSISVDEFLTGIGGRDGI